MGRGKKWRRDEDVSLAAAYAAVAAAGVKEGPSFWDAVRSRVQSARSVRALRNRWVFMVQEVKAFVACLDRLEAEGGGREEVALERAMSDFRATRGRDFEFLNCWDLVRSCCEGRVVGGRGGEAAKAEAGIDEARGVDYVEARANGVGATAAAACADAAPAVALAAPSRAMIEYEAPPQTTGVVVVATKKETTTRPTKAAVGLKTKSAARARTAAATTEDLTSVQQQLVSEMRRKNDLQEDELALKLFGEGHESDESQQFFKLLKRKKLLLLEKEVDELERGQQRQRKE
ncbi:unnamed protein product [Hyaloperonospora brassicae]|uniref:Myb-like domain-containing protein n=1 Tax=Hyaloperonospora brassicae TaxID=162125 RepID=A0AAV0TD39_HYABA|nr:unnamed protein product [Hyaloperonospora brassicae]